MWLYLSRNAAVLAAYACCAACVVRAAPEAAELAISARTDEVASDWTTVVYDVENPILVGNDGDAGSGGFRAFELDGGDPPPEFRHETPGRTKLVAAVYGVDGKDLDLVVTIAQTDSLFRLYDASTFEQVGEPLRETLGDWSALCAWKSQRSGLQYLYLFGKHQAVQFLFRGHRGSLDVTEIQTFKTPVEASSCAVSLSEESVFFSGDDDPAVYAFKAAESTATPDIKTLGEADDDVTGLAVYVGMESDYLAVAQKDVVSVYDVSLVLLGSLTLTGDEDIEVQGLSFYQGSISNYSTGVLAYALESEAGKGFGVSSLGAAFDTLKLKLNTAYDPKKLPCKSDRTVCRECSNNGFCGTSGPAARKESCSVCVRPQPL